MFLATTALAVLLSAAGAPAAQEGSLFERGVEAYRRAAYTEAEELWRRCLREPLSASDRARVTYDLGNAAWRQEDALSAVGWYTLSTRTEPRNADAWHNLELARAEAGLEPADRGDLRATVRRLYTAFTPEESRLLLLLALVPLAIALGFEVFRGGRLWRILSVLCLLIVLAAGVPWAFHLLAAEGDGVLAVRPASVALRSEPRSELAAIGQLEPGEEAQRIDALPGWIRIEKADGTRGWLQEDAVFSLRYPSGK